MRARAELPELSRRRRRALAYPSLRVEAVRIRVRRRVAPEEKVGAGHGNAPSPKLRKLFRDYKGVFDVCSSDSFQYSFGGVFTPTLIDKVLLGNTPETWEAVFEKTQKITMASAEGALPADAKKKLKREGKVAEDHQKPVAIEFPKLG